MGQILLVHARLASCMTLLSCLWRSWVCGPARDISEYIMEVQLCNVLWTFHRNQACPRPRWCNEYFFLRLLQFQSYAVDETSNTVGLNFNMTATDWTNSWRRTCSNALCRIHSPLDHTGCAPNRRAQTRAPGPPSPAQ